MTDNLNNARVYVSSRAEVRGLTPAGNGHFIDPEGRDVFVAPSWEQWEQSAADCRNIEVVLRRGRTVIVMQVEEAK